MQRQSQKTRQTSSTTIKQKHQSITVFTNSFHISLSNHYIWLISRTFIRLQQSTVIDLRVSCILTTFNKDDDDAASEKLDE